MYKKNFPGFICLIVLFALIFSSCSASPSIPLSSLLPNPPVSSYSSPSSAPPLPSSTAPSEPEEPEDVIDIKALKDFFDNKLISSNAILISLDESEAIYEKDAETILYPASMTKIMTTIIALENIDDLSKTTSISQSLYDYLLEMDASILGIPADEIITLEDLVYGNLLVSGADCSISLAEFIAESEYDFVALMNKKAAEIGMTDTLFTNCTGLHDENHYSTVKDISILLKYALTQSPKSDEFKKMFSTENYSLISDSYPDGLVLSSTFFGNPNVVKFKNNKVKLLGGKTGFTAEAGLCLASSAEIFDGQYIIVTAGADGNHYTEQFGVIDHLNSYKALTSDFNFISADDAESDTDELIPDDDSDNEDDLASDADSATDSDLPIE